MALRLLQYDAINHIECNVPSSLVLVAVSVLVHNARPLYHARTAYGCKSID